MMLVELHSRTAWYCQLLLADKAAYAVLALCHPPIICCLWSRMEPKRLVFPPSLPLLC
jgi:hypothetical protein